MCVQTYVYINFMMYRATAMHAECDVGFISIIVQEKRERYEHYLLKIEPAYANERVVYINPFSMPCKVCLSQIPLFQNIRD